MIGIMGRFGWVRPVRRSLLSTTRTKMSEAERQAALRDANEKMKAYHVNRPSLEVIHNSKRRSRARQYEHDVQLSLCECLCVCV